MPIDEANGTVDDSSGKEADKSFTTPAGVQPPEHSHKEEDMVNDMSTVIQDTLTLDSTPTIADDSSDKDDLAKEAKGDEVMNTISTADMPASSDGVTDEVCYYYDSSQYNRVLTETFRAVHSDMTDGGDVDIVSVPTPDLDQIINGHPLRLYKRTAKV